MSDSKDRDAAIDRWLRRASASTPDVRTTAACLDSEVMAAWIDGRLSGAALAGADAHVAGCARCQAIAATMVRTETIAQWATPERPSPWRWLTWGVPLTAAATVVAVVLVEWRKPPSTPNQARADAPRIVDARPAEPAPATPVAPPAATKPDLKDEAERRGLAQERRGNARDAEAKARARSEVAADKTSSLAQSSREATTGSRQRPSDQKVQQKPAAPARAEELGRMAAAAQANEATVLEIRSPDPAIRWRVVRGRVQRSVDTGTTWTDIPTGVAATGITAGAAPASSVCWLAGLAGMVLLTTDGRTWQRVSVPEPTDLSAIRATDGRNAIVTTSDGREFATTDGGRSWVRRDLQEILTAPF